MVLNTQGKIIIITAPSGSGKSTLIKRLMEEIGGLSFSISACTRQPRGQEQHGKDYYFYSVDEFKQLIQDNALLEWEMVYEGKYYGTLRSELSRIWNDDNTPLFDIDVQGAMNVQKQYPDNSLSIFIQAPSIEELKSRLEKRGTETAETLNERVGKAEEELSYAKQFDTIIINDDLEEASQLMISTVKDFLSAE